MEFSKKILIVIAIVLFVTLIFSGVMIWRTLDLSPINTIIQTIGGLATIGIVAYFSKAKVENRIKLMKENNVQLENDDFDE